jgi:hypothetical protein
MIDNPVPDPGTRYQILLHPSKDGTSRFEVRFEEGRAK